MLFRRCRALKYDLSESLRTENSQGLVAAYLHGLDGYAALVLAIFIEPSCTFNNRPETCSVLFASVVESRPRAES